MNTQRPKCFVCGFTIENGRRPVAHAECYKYLHKIVYVNGEKTVKVGEQYVSVQKVLQTLSN